MGLFAEPVSMFLGHEFPRVVSSLDGLDARSGGLMFAPDAEGIHGARLWLPRHGGRLREANAMMKLMWIAVFSGGVGQW